MTLANGVHIQVYRGSSAYSDVKLKEFAARAKSLGVVGLVAHGFQGELPRNFDSFANICERNCLQASAAWGLGDAGTVQNAERIGRTIGGVALHEKCEATLFDMEGAWEDEQADLPRAHALFKAFREVAGAAFAGDQPWSMPIPRHHAMPIWWEIAKYLNARFPQFYWNNLRKSFGDDAYAIFRAKYEDAWKWFHANRPGPHPPRFVTVQGYHWRDWTLVDALCRYAVDAPLVMWCEAFPTENTEQGMRAWVALRDRGFTGPRAVEQFQRSPAGVAAGLVVDNKCESKTRTALGL